MKLLQLVPVGASTLRTIEELGPALSQAFGIPWDVLPETLDSTFALHAERQQYHSTEILARLQSQVRAECWRLVGITDDDLYIPILTFVFGEAQMSGPVAVVSTHRLHQEFYGLPQDDDLFRERVLKEALHEIGHTLGLRHCEDYRCAMAGAHGVEWIDLKEAALCPECQSKIELPVLTHKKRLWPF
jgi:archaemetzincin